MPIQPCPGGLGPRSLCLRTIFQADNVVIVVWNGDLDLIRVPKLLQSIDAITGRSASLTWTLLPGYDQSWILSPTSTIHILGSSQLEVSPYNQKMGAKSIYAGDASSIYATNTMFPTDISDEDDLKFDLATPLGWEYTPGDTVIGNVIRKNALVTPECTLTVWFAGRVRTQIWRDRDARYGPDVYDERWNLFDGGHDVIHDGPLHHPDDSGKPLSWSIAIKTRSKPSASAAKGHDQVTSFISLEKPPTTLPGTFYAHGSDFPMRSEGMVEYAIHGRLNYTRKGQHKVRYATVPISIRHPADLSAHPGESKECNGHYPIKIQTQRLLPGMEDAELSLGQKTRKLLRSSKVPEFWYEVVIAAPTAVQLENPEPFPLILSFLSRDDKTSASIKGHPQKVHINWVNLHLHCITAVMAPSNLRSNTAQKDQQTNEINLRLERIFDDLKSPLVMQSIGKENEPINLGNLFQLNLRSDGLYTATRRMVRWPSLHTIYPDFSTYGIKHTHALEPSVSISVAGEEKTIKFKPVQLRVIGAS